MRTSGPFIDARAPSHSFSSTRPSQYCPSHRCHLSRSRPLLPASPSPSSHALHTGQLQAPSPAMDAPEIRSTPASTLRTPSRQGSATHGPDGQHTSCTTQHHPQPLQLGPAASPSAQHTPSPNAQTPWHSLAQHPGSTIAQPLGLAAWPICPPQPSAAIAPAQQPSASASHRDIAGDLAAPICPGQLSCPPQLWIRQILSANHRRSPSQRRTTPLAQHKPQPCTPAPGCLQNTPNRPKLPQASSSFAHLVEETNG
ncbi:hypothetical protein Taro_043920 [Colocasia esculenta]|uniref:Uncharacterized protein n=1 Tax=Colocasia esculenta TaxID=4460 RepID=A0A843WZT2_COLES|nr:hypothetical protein [Colocasia esculenta]